MKKWSSFIFAFDTETEKVLFNTRNTGIIAIEKEIYSKISDSLKQPHCTTSYNEEITQLQEMGFIVDIELDEFDGFFNSVIQSRDKENMLLISLMTTTNCNFACRYCYEDGIKKTYNLDEAVVLALISYIQNYIDNNTISIVHISLYGGEPTLSWDFVVFTLEKVKKICDARGIRMVTSMLTNGFLLDKQKALDLIPFNFNSIQVTLDGSKDFHDKRRYTEKGEPTFDVILSNIHDLIQVSDNVKVNIRMNCDKENIESIPELAECIYNNFGSDRVAINFGYIIVNPSKENNHSTTPCLSDINITEQSFAEQLPTLFASIAKYGFKTPEYYHFDGYCAAKTNHCFTLHPSGDIYKCLTMVGIEEQRAGTVFDVKQFENYFNKDAYLECIKKKCCFLPLCHAGCPYNSLVKYNDVSKVYCKKEQLIEVNKRFILAKLSID